MGHLPLRFRKAPTVLFGVSCLLFMGAPIHARTMPHANRPAQSQDASAREIVEFNHFLESHQDVSVELHSKPWLVDNYNYLQNHPELKSYLNDHPGVKDEISQNPVAFMNEDAQRSELAQFSRFLDTHREVAEQLRSNPTLADNYNFLQSHPELRTYLQEHTAVQEALHDNAVTFMKEEDGFNRNFNNGRGENAGGPGPGPGVNPGGPDRDRPMPPDRDREQYRRQLADFNRFLDDHREIAEQVRKNPSLADDREFVRNHPPLDNFLRDNPGVRDDLRQDPNAFMHQEDRINMAENHDYRDARHDHMADFGGFLGDHHEIARDLDRDPDSVKNREFVQNRPDLDKYLNAHPDVRSDLMANPHDFVKGAQQMSNGEHTTGAGMSGSGNGSGGGSTATGTTGTKSTGGENEPPAPAPKNKQ
jgi:hypothetical protein